MILGGTTRERLWIIDPLDGTTEFGEPGRTDWAVHVALWQRGEGLIEGAVALPARGMTLSTADPLPALQTPPDAAAARGEPDPAAGLGRCGRRAGRRRLDADRQRRDEGDVDLARRG